MSPSERILISDQFEVNVEARGDGGVLLEVEHAFGLGQAWLFPTDAEYVAHWLILMAAKAREGDGWADL